MINNKKYIDINYSDKKQLRIGIAILVLAIIAMISALAGLASSITGMIVLFQVSVDKNELNWINIMSLIVVIMSLIILLVQLIPNGKGINKFGVSITCVLLDILQVIILFNLAGTYLDVNADDLAICIIVFDTITYSSLITIIILALFIIED